MAYANHGATDAKITSYEYIKQLKQRVISSPPYEKMPAFDWSTVEFFNITHIGLPEKWEFPWADVDFND